MFAWPPRAAVLVLELAENASYLETAYLIILSALHYSIERLAETRHITGRELAEYFLSHGPGGALLGMAVLYGVFAAVMVLVVGEPRLALVVDEVTGDYRDYMADYLRIPLDRIRVAPPDLPFAPRLPPQVWDGCGRRATMKVRSKKSEVRTQSRVIVFYLLTSYV